MVREVRRRRLILKSLNYQETSSYDFNNKRILALVVTSLNYFGNLKWKITQRIDYRNHMWLNCRRSEGSNPSGVKPWLSNNTLN